MKSAPEPLEPDKTPENRTPDSKEWRLPMLALAGAFDLPRSTFQDMLQRADLRSNGGYPVLDAAKMAIHHFKGLSEKEASEAARDDARRKKSEADLAELKLGREAGSLVEVEEMKRLLTSAIVRYREKIRQLPGLTLDQKKDVMEQLATLTLEEVEE